MKIKINGKWYDKLVYTSFLAAFNFHKNYTVKQIIEHEKQIFTPDSHREILRISKLF